MSKSESLDKIRIGSKGDLAVALSRLKGFVEPKVRVEQYITDAEIVAEVFWNVKLRGDIGKVSVDLGCGTGILGIGLLLLGADKVIFIESEDKALKIAKENFKKVKSEYYFIGKAIFLLEDIKNFNENVDLVMQNPPFGTKVRHTDKFFLENAFKVSNLVYSFHKTETKKFIEKFSTENGFNVTNIWDFNFPLKASYSFHTRKIKRIKVSCFRIEKNKQ